MKPAIVLDASVIIKWFRTEGEEKFLEAREYRAKMLAKEITILVPDLLYFEIINAAKNDRSQSEDAWNDALEMLFDSPLETVPLEKIYGHKIYDLAKELNISAYDAPYLVLAKDNGTVVVTPDRELLTKAPDLTKSL